MVDFFSDPKIVQQLGYLSGGLLDAVWQTLYATVLSTLFAHLLGIPLGVLLVVGEEGGVRPLPGALMKALNVVVNLLRSVPFLILMVVVFPLSRLLLGSSIGTPATIVPLTIAAFPFVARLVESALREVDRGVVEAAQAMGCSPMQLITKVLLPEGRPALISAFTTAFITILSYGAMSGAIGGGGLGSMAINLGHTRNMTLVLWVAVIVLVILVQIFQSVGTYLSVRLDKRITRRGKK
ncbi:DL-methionine transporter subunit; membrane component protein of ABC superfamily [uncultured Eubacteriales bacterium]|uniref:DL-methionine transporter subunit membrane component protein of ABC superfamily n=1 Tax=uncultured Eubacteriales bacterium TaxID=172733 RepID=A0A212KF75_9FIRM|nr:DL-methionine transporter subunit; membrane component protein of ABC superfamily [uncultured Eubacteriales bacterium]